MVGGIPRHSNLGGPYEDHVEAIKGPSFGNLKDKRGLKGKPHAPEGNHYSTQPPSPIISSSFPFGQMQSSASWSPHFLTPSVSFFLPFSARLLEISVNINARTLKFGMSYPLTHSRRVWKNTLGKPGEDHIGARKGLSFGNLKDKRGLQERPPAPEGYHCSPPPLSPSISSTFFLWAIAELYILVPLHTNSLSFSLPLTDRK